MPRLLALGLLGLIISPLSGGELVYKDRMLKELVGRVPSILKQFDAGTGRFGSGIWICMDQQPMYTLAVVYATQSPANPYYRSPKLLDVIAKSGRPLIEAMNDTGEFLFQKKDGSTWGNIRMPWMYSRWIRTFNLIHGDMSEADREAWSKALTLGYTNIAKHEFRYYHNIPTYHAFGLYVAGKTLGKPAWCTQASDFLVKIAERQAEGGYWSEHSGPVVNYNVVYVDAIGMYYALSRDERVLAALGRSAAFHSAFTYPDGRRVETIDERNPYHSAIDHGNVGLSATPVGRALLARQWELVGLKSIPEDALASFVQYGQEGPIAELTSRPAEPFILREGGQDRAAIIRTGPWFLCLSAYTAVPDRDRWHQDRQNLVSIWHEGNGLILGGGNTRLQPAWSNFTVGDISLLRHKAGDENPDFRPKGELYHIPSAAELLTSPQPGLLLTYGPAKFRLSIDVKGPSQVVYSVEVVKPSALPMAAHLTLMPRLGTALETGSGQKQVLGKEPVNWTPEQLAGSLTYAGCRLQLPPAASVHWPLLAHNPYHKDGSATIAEGRVEIRIPLDEQHKAATVTFDVP